jgi:membrane protease YdiL (CAAX protease family)
MKWQPARLDVAAVTRSIGILMSGPPAPPVELPHSLARSVALHLVPGVLTTAVYLVLAKPMMAAGFPALFGLLLATALVLIPLELGYLLFRAKRTTGSYSLRGIVLFREPLPKSQYLVWPVVLFLWGFASSILAAPLDDFLGRRLFSGLPSWFFVSSADQFASFSRPVLTAMFGLGIAVVGFAGPIVEELYFRGYLLPRLGRVGRWAPLLHAVLFSLYHFWTPWQNPSRILLMAPMTYLVWWKRNLYLAMLAHGALNTVVWIITFGTILRAHS